MRAWRRFVDALTERAMTAEDDRFLEALQVVIQRARAEFSCMYCAEDSIEILGVNDCEVEQHVYARIRCANCTREFLMLTHHLIAAAGHAMASFDRISLHLDAKDAGVFPGQDPDADSLYDLGL